MENLTIYEIKVSFLTYKENPENGTRMEFEDKNNSTEIKGVNLVHMVGMIKQEISSLSEKLNRIYFSPTVIAHSLDNSSGILYFDKEETRKVNKMACKAINNTIKKIEKKRGF